MPRRNLPRRICIAPLDVASYYSGLRDGFLALGVPCWLFDFDASLYTRYRPTAKAFFLERWVFAVAQSPWLRASRAGRGLRMVLLGVLRAVACVCAIIACDVFVFAFSRTFLGGFELPLLRFLGRTVICVFNGSDTRAPWMSGLFTLGPGTPDAKAIYAEVIRQQRCLRRFERWASACICHPLSAHLLRRPFINHLKIGLPCAVTPTLTGRTARPASAALHLVHAPTRPLQKGSGLFLGIVERLRAEGHAIEYLELTGRPNHEVLAAIADCDLVLDESYSDTPLAGLGCEAACYGRPAVVGGFGADDVAYFARDTGLPTALFVPPCELEATIRQLVSSPMLRSGYGRAAQAFLSRTWTPIAVAARYLQIAQGTAPAAWQVDPATLTYWQGWGAPEECTLRACHALISLAGPKALGIDHNPPLLTLILSRIYSRNSKENT
jgi:hypothetical protein